MFLVVVALAMVVLAARLVQLQVGGAGSYRREAEANLVRAPVLLETRRGAIRDRNGLVLAEDTARFDVCMYYPFMAVEDEAFIRRTAARRRLPIRDVRRRMAPLWLDNDRFVEHQAEVRNNMVPEKIERMLSDFWPRLAKETGIDIALLDERREAILRKVYTIREAVRRRHGRAMPIREESDGPRGIAHPIIVDIDEPTKAVIAVLQTRYDWLIVEQHAKRVYRYNQCAAHVVGRVGEVNKETLGTSPDGSGPSFGDDRQRVYRLHDLKGLSGIELGMERFLRGRRGIEQRDKAGKLLLHEPPQSGQDVRLTLDVPFQSEIEAFMSRPPTPLAHRGRVCGAAVVIDIRTGGLLALVSVPGFNPNTFSEDFPDLVAEGAGQPLLHRAVAGQLAQGSIFKAVTATAALHENKITPRTVFTCNRFLEPGRPDRFKCLGRHGPISLHRAIVRSCNVYFYNTGMSIGSAKLTEWGRRFGFGARIGLLLPGEKAGRLPPGEDPRNLAIGQGGLTVTPLQSARFMALIAADGRMTEVHLVAAPRPKNRPLVEVDMKLNPRYTAIVRRALTGVVNEEGGTGYKYVRSDLVRIAGKTGSAQTGRSDQTHAWFVGFAPADDPQIAFSVVFEHGGGGGSVAGPVARQIAEAALRLGIITTRTALRR
ncbi:MAG: hypothetical protein GWP05_02495 [Anaerolineaceae bacterium]|nr:hypothetical protein [Anaerolineaceae bacterium]